MKAKITEDEVSVTVERDGKKYVLYFDKEEFAIYVENESRGSYAEILIPVTPGEHVKFEYWENW